MNGVAAKRLTPPRPQKIPGAKIRWKSSRLDFWDQDGILLIDYLPKSYYQRGVFLISADATEGHFEGKALMPREVHQGVLFLHHNAPAHRAHATQNKLAYLGFQCLDHPTYSPELAPSDYHLFPGLKKKIGSSLFSADAEVNAAAETWLHGQLSEFFLVAHKS